MSNKKGQYYLGNQNLPTPDAEFEWTSDMMHHMKKCKKNILHFAENFFYIISEKGRHPITLHKYQRGILRKMRDDRFFILLASRQVGKTTLMTVYALWNACFNDDQRILIVANKEGTAIEIFKRVRMAYEELPNWLKPGVTEYGKTSMALGNGTTIGISTTTGTAARGQSCNVLILDELAFIDNHLVDEFWKSVYPIISSFKKSKIFISSTPNGTENLFHKLYTGAINNTNGWSHGRVDWWEVPGRDDAWKQEQIRNMGSQEAFDQEFGCQFLQTGESTIDDELHELMKNTCHEPEYIFDDGKYLLWEEPDVKKIYTVGVDVSEGVDLDASCIQILDITHLNNIKQVATYHNNGISPYLFTKKLHEILQHWGNPLVAIERNNCGAQVVDNLANEMGYRNIVSFAPTIKGRAVERLGVVAHTNTKYKGVVNMRYWLTQLKCISIYDKALVHELKNFVRYPNGTWRAREGNYYDDRVMSLLWSLIVLENTVVDKYFEVEQYDDNEKPLLLRELDYGVKEFVNPVGLYANQRTGDHIDASPMVFGQATGMDSELFDLESQGWERL